MYKVPDSEGEYSNFVFPCESFQCLLVQKTHIPKKVAVFSSHVTVTEEEDVAESESRRHREIRRSQNFENVGAAEIRTRRIDLLLCDLQIRAVGPPTDWKQFLVNYILTLKM